MAAHLVAEASSKLSKRLETTEYNSIQQIPGLYSVYSYGMAVALRIIAVTFGIASVLCSTVNIYLLKSFHEDSKVFRHDFLLWLFCFDLSKDFILTVFPLLTLITVNTYNWSVFYNIVGFLTNLAMVGADFTVFFIAIHFALLIFKPNLNVIDPRRNKVEGGLYRYRIYVFSFILIFSTLCSSLAFINFNTNNFYVAKQGEVTKVTNNDGKFVVKQGSQMGGYKPLATIVGLTIVPFYYGLFLNWLWRYCILISIIMIYVMIYLRYLKDSKANQLRIKKLQQNCRKNTAELGSGVQEIEDITNEFNNLIYQEFAKRKQIFKKQLLQLFLYPTYYLILWIAPLIENIEQPIYEIKNGPMVPLTIITTICHPANGIFDLIIFMAREKPFENYWSTIESKRLISEYLENQNKGKMVIEDKWELCNNTVLGKRGFYYSSNAMNNVVENKKFVIDNHSKVTLFWRLYHRLPLKGGIDLDTLEYTANIPMPKNDILVGNDNIASNESSVESKISQSEMFAMVNKYKNERNSGSELNGGNNADNVWITQLLSSKEITNDRQQGHQITQNDNPHSVNESIALPESSQNSDQDLENEHLDIRQFL